MPRLERPPTPEGASHDKPLTVKELAAKEAIGRSRLQLQQTLGRFAAVERFAAAVPYVLMGLGALGTLLAGAYVGTQLMNSGRERRQQTIERAADETLQKPRREEAKAAERPAAETKR
jgi:hypothetical protein